MISRQNRVTLYRKNIAQTQGSAYWQLIYCDEMRKCQVFRAFQEFIVLWRLAYGFLTFSCPGCVKVICSAYLQKKILSIRGLSDVFDFILSLNVNVE